MRHLVFSCVLFFAGTGQLLLTAQRSWAQAQNQLPSQPPSDTSGRTTGDWEDLLASQSQAQRAWRFTSNRLAGQKISALQRQKILTGVMERFPDSQGAAKLQYSIVRNLGDEGRWDEYVAGASAWFKSFGRWSEPKHDLLYDMARRLYQKDAPDTVKRSVFDCMLPQLAHRAWLAGYTGNYISRLDLADAQKYELAHRVAKVAGPDSRVLAMLWSHIAKLQTSDPKLALVAAKELLEQYGADHPQTRQAKIFILEQASVNGDTQAAAQAKTLEQESKLARTQLKASMAKAKLQLLGADPLAATQALEDLIKSTPAYEHLNLWQQVSQELADMTPLVRIAIMRQFAGQLPDDSVAEVFRIWALADLISQPQDVEVLFQIQQQCNNDAGRSLNMWDYTLKLLQNADYPPAVIAHGYAIAAQAATRLGADDQAAAWLFDAAKLNWVFDLSVAKAQLAQAARTSHWSAEGAKAAWLLAFLEGKNDVIQPSVPRDYDPANEVPQALAPCQLPALGQVQPAIIKTDQGWALATSDPNRNLLANQTPTASTDQAHANLAVDDDPQTAWQPASLPAVLIVPLQQQATPDHINIDLENPTHLAISLLDAAGQPLARFERDWSFWDTYSTDAMWANGSVSLKLPPVKGVSFIRLELFASRGPAGVNHIALYPTAHTAAGWHVGEAVKIQPQSSAILVRHQATEPTTSIKLLADSEASAGYPIYRWLEPWKRTKGHVILKQFGGHFSQVFYGQNLSITLSHTGGLDWQIDDGPIGHIDKTQAEQATFTLADNLHPTKHILRLTQRALPARNDTWGADDIRVVSMNVNAQASIRSAARFSVDGKSWGPWLETLLTDQNAITAMSIPNLADGRRPVFVQAGAWFDSRSTRGKASPVLQSLKIDFTNQQGQTGKVFQSDHLPRLVSELDKVARLLQQRRVVVVYPKVGSPRMYGLAKALADKANVYLVSDDIALNNYPGLVLAVGSPLRHRYTRQLLASHGLWLNADYLRSAQGLVTLTRDEDNQPQTLYVMGETPQAIEEAATRLMKKLNQLATDQPRVAEAASVELFAASTLEMIYPWQLHTDRTSLNQLALRLGINDRRSTQFGLRINESIQSFIVTPGVFTGPGGATLSAKQIMVRYASGYEWIPFFGDLRLPNGLSHKPVLPIAKDTALGVWLTATSDATTKPGDYRGSLTVQANGKTSHVPVMIKVEPVTFPKSPTIATYSFAGVPYWFTQGSSLWRDAVVSLAANEAEHRVNYVSVSFSLDWNAAKHQSPARYATTTKADASQDKLRKWNRLTGAVTANAGQSLEFQFAQPVSPWMVGVGLEGEQIKRVTLQVQDEQNLWVDVASYDDFAAMPSPVLLNTRQTLQSPASTYRLIFDSASPVTVHKITAFTDRNEQAVLVCDFGQMFKQMDLIDGVYQARGLPLPGYIAQINTEAGQISRLLFGVFSTTQNICAQMVARQLAAALKKTGRSDRFLLKVGDEPGDLVKWAAMAEPYHKEGLQTMTCHGVNYPDMSVATGLINPWVPNYQHNINLPFLRERQKQGDKLWWYECGVPATRLTGSPIDNLPFYWLTAKWHLQGAMSYAAMHTSDFSMPVPFRYEHGLDHRIMFRADGSVLDTTRRELESDGIGDCELIALIRRQLSRSDSPASKQIQARLDALIESIVPYKYGYETSPQKWEAARNVLYDMAIESQRL